MAIKVSECPFCGYPQSGTKVKGGITANTITGFSDTTLFVLGAFIAGIVFGPAIKRKVKAKL